MSDPRPIAVELQIDETRPLSGRLRDHDGPWRGFAGWIGLAGAIDGVLDRHGGSGPPPDPPAAPAEVPGTRGGPGGGALPEVGDGPGNGAVPADGDGTGPPPA